jgi:hypothetical protein
MRKLLIALAASLMSLSALAVDGTWIGNASANWSNTGSWTNGIVADGAGYTATLGAFINGGRTITLDTPRTIGSVYALDPGDIYTIGGTNRLTLDNGVSLSGVSSPSLIPLYINTPVTLNSGLYKTDLGTVTFQGPITLGGSQTWQTLQGSIATATGANAIVLGANTLTFSGDTGFFSLGTISSTNATIVGSGNLVKTGAGRLSVGGLMASQLSGGTVTINGGVMHVVNDSEVLRGCNVTINGGVLSFYWGCAYTRTLGTGTNQVQITGGASGFGGSGSSGPVVNLGATAVWGSTYFNPSVLVLGDSQTGNNATTSFNSRLDLNGTTRTIDTPRGTSVLGNVVTMAAITNSVGTADLIKTGGASITFTSVANYMNGAFRVQEGIVNFTASTLFGSPSVVVSSGASFESQSTGALTQAFPVSGAGTWRRMGSPANGTLTLTAAVSTTTAVVTNSIVNASVPGAFSCANLCLYRTTATPGTTLNLIATNAISDTARVCIVTGSGGAYVPNITFGAGAGRSETIGSLFIDGVQQPVGTYGGTGSGAQYIIPNVFSSSNGVVVVGVRPRAVAVDGRLLVIDGKTIVID